MSLLKVSTCFDPSRPTFYRKRTVSQRKRENAGNPRNGAWLCLPPHSGSIRNAQGHLPLSPLLPAGLRARANTGKVDQAALLCSLGPDI